jgi:hypothetical protein
MELDLSLDAFVDLGNKVDQIHKSMPRFAKVIHRQIGNSFVSNAAATSPQILEINQRPAPGYMWYVLKVGIFGTDGHTVVSTALADIYAGPLLDLLSGVPFTDFSSQILSGVAIPSITTWGHKSVPMHQNESIYALLYSLPASQPVELVATIAEWPVAAEEALSQ